MIKKTKTESGQAYPGINGYSYQFVKNCFTKLFSDSVVGSYLSTLGLKVIKKKKQVEKYQGVAA